MFEVVAAMFIWGTLGVFVLWTKLPMIEIAFYRCLIGTIVLILFLIIKRQKIPYFFTMSVFFRIVLSGILLVSNWVLLFYSFKLASITVGNTSYYLQPIFLLLLGIFVFKEKISFGKFVLVFLSFVGVLLTSQLNLLDLQSHNSFALGVFCALFAGFLYALVTILTKPIKSVSPVLVTLTQLLVGTAALLPFIKNNLTAGFQSSHLLILIVIIGVLHTAIAYMLYYRGIQKITVTQIAILSYIDPIVAIGSDIVVYHRHLDMGQVAGIVLVLVAGYLVVNPVGYLGRKLLRPGTN